MGFLFHKLFEREREEIKKQVDTILKSFSDKLSKIDKKTEENLVERKKFEREEGDGKDESFSKDLMFRNAPEKNKDFIIAEKKKW